MPATLVPETQAVKRLDFKDLTRLVDNKLEQLRNAKQTAEVQRATRILTQIKVLGGCSEANPDPICGPHMEAILLPID